MLPSFIPKVPQGYYDPCLKAYVIPEAPIAMEPPRPTTSWLMTPFPWLLIILAWVVA